MRITFGTDGWRDQVDAFTPDRVRTLGRAVAGHLAAEEVTGPVIVGMDPRASSPAIADELADVLSAAGRAVLRPVRDCPTPIVAYTVVDRDAAGALMVTASHNPPEYNGIKFIPADGAPASTAVTTAITDRLGTAGPEGPEAAVETIDPHPAYRRHLASLLPGRLDGLDIVYDAMHGAGRGITDAILQERGATVTTIRGDRDPTFGGQAPEPTPQHLEPLVEQVRAEGADLGIANDGDADRVAVVTPDRGVLSAHLLFAAVYAARSEHRHGPVVRTVSTSTIIDAVAAAHGAEVIEVPVGFKWVAAAMQEHAAVMGGEESGGFTIAGHLREKDGVMMALLLAQLAHEDPLDERIDHIESAYGTVHTGLRSIQTAAPSASRLLEACDENIAGLQVERTDRTDGVKLWLEGDAWLLIRPSGTEPKVRVYAEAADAATVTAIIDAGAALVRALSPP
jgi:Phosphomannomutase